MTDGHAQRLADQYNAGLARTDVEWAVSSTGDLYLRDRPSFTSANTRAIADQHERERRIWLRNYRQRNPASDAA